MQKDQSYFLWTLTSEELKHVLFPIGHLQKSEVRNIGEKAEIPVFDKKDSQGVCFIGHIDMKEFLKEYIKTEDGEVLDVQGNVIGTHQGALLYTHGERHAFTLFSQSSEQKRLFVIDKNIEHNTITVGELCDVEQLNKNKESLMLKNVVLRRELLPDEHVTCRTRYRQEKIEVTHIDKRLDTHIDNTLTLTLTQYPVTSAGQSVVLYVGHECVGGGVLL
jgi:tRNA-specific 2-thiouridylase